MWLLLAGLELCQILISVQVTTQKSYTKGGNKIPRSCWSARLT